MKKILAIVTTLLMIFTMLFVVSTTTPVKGIPTTHYVPDDFDTIQEAIDSSSVVDGDIIVVRAGDRAGAVVTKSLSIIGEDGATIVTGPAHHNYPKFLIGFKLGYGAGGNGATISNFIFECGGASSATLTDPALVFPVFTYRADGITVSHNTIYNTLQGITNWEGDNWNIYNNEFIDLQTSCGGGIAIHIGAIFDGDANYNMVSKNIIRGKVNVPSSDCLGYSPVGISLYSDHRWGTNPGGDVSGNVIEHNEISLKFINDPDMKVNGIELSENHYPLETYEIAYDIHDNTISHNYITNADFGINILHGKANVIQHNTLYKNKWHGLYMISSKENGIHHNTVLENVFQGIVIEDSDFNSIHHNILDRNGRNGIVVREIINVGGGSNFNEIHHNIADGNGWDGIRVRGEDTSDNIVHHNKLTNNDFYGIRVHWKAHTNTFSFNEAYANHGGFDYYMHKTGSEKAGPGNVWTNNVGTRNF